MYRCFRKWVAKPPMILCTGNLSTRLEKKLQIQTNSARNNGFVSFLYTESIWKPKVQKEHWSGLYGKSTRESEEKAGDPAIQRQREHTDACSTLKHTDLSMISQLNLHC